MTATIELEEDYVPCESETFMNERQRAFFTEKLTEWKRDLLRETQGTVEALQNETRNVSDIADRASEEADRALELRTRDRQRKLISKIDSALRRIETGDYGYCDATGDPISLKRLIARPTATMSLDAQEKHERRERVYRDD